MRTCLSHLAILQHQDLVAIVDGPQSMGNKDARASLLLQDTVDVLQQCLFGICVEGRSLLCRQICEITVQNGRELK